MAPEAATATVPPSAPPPVHVAVQKNDENRGNVAPPPATPEVDGNR
jgi:hypothetical protein